MVATFTSCPSSRQLLCPMPAESLVIFGDALAKLKLEAVTLSPFVIWSIVKAEAKATKEFVSGGVTNFIKPADITSLGEKRKPAMIKANKMIQTYHETADKIGLDLSLIHI